MKNTNMNFELLKKRRELILKRRAKEQQEMNIGLGYTHMVDGKCYTVLSSFPVGTNTGGAEDKLRYLINGKKD